MTAARPTAIPGFLHAENKGAIDLRNGLLAYGCGVVVVVVCPVSVQLVQTLDGHKARVCHVSWAPRPPSRCSLLEDCQPLLASADSNGDVIVWDALRGERVVAIPRPSNAQALLRMHWLPQRPNLLLCAHSPGVLTLRQVSADGVELLWRCDYPEPLALIDFDPFVPSRVCVYTRSGQLAQLGGVVPRAAPDTARASVYQLSKLATAQDPVRAAAVGRAAAAKGGDGGGLPLIQLVYSLHAEAQLFLVLPRELHLFDLKMGHVLASVTLDRTDHSFSGIRLSEQLPTALIGVHADGTVSLWSRRTASRSPSPEKPAEGRKVRPEGQVNFAFEGMAPLASRGDGTTLLSVCVDGWRLGGVGTDGRVWLWRLPPHERVAAGEVRPEWAPAQVGLIAAVGAPIRSAAMGPEGVLALGTDAGRVVLLSARCRCAVGEYSLHDSAAVRGVEWRGASELISFSSAPAGGAGWRNRVVSLRLPSGAAREIFGSRGAEPAPLTALRSRRRGGGSSPSSRTLPSRCGTCRRARRSARRSSPPSPLCLRSHGSHPPPPPPPRRRRRRGSQ